MLHDRLGYGTEKNFLICIEGGPDDVVNHEQGANVDPSLCGQGLF